MRPGPAARWTGAAAVLAAVLGAVCRAPSDEARVRALLKEAAALAEKRDLDGLAGLFAPDYRDFQGRDTAGTLRLIGGHLDRYRGVVIHVLGARIAEPAPDGGLSVECEIAMSHGAAEVLRRLIRFTGEYYRFRIEARRTGPGEWRIAYAEWESIGLEGLFPESLARLKELFPGL
jgi:hypothetical protein